MIYTITSTDTLHTELLRWCYVGDRSAPERRRRRKRGFICDWSCFFFLASSKRSALLPARCLPRYSFVNLFLRVVFLLVERSFLDVFTMQVRVFLPCNCPHVIAFQGLRPKVDALLFRPAVGYLLLDLCENVCLASLSWQSSLASSARFLPCVEKAVQ